MSKVSFLNYYVIKRLYVANAWICETDFSVSRFIVLPGIDFIAESCCVFNIPVSFGILTSVFAKVVLFFTAFNSFVTDGTPIYWGFWPPIFIDGAWLRLKVPIYIMEAIVGMRFKSSKAYFSFSFWLLGKYLVSPTTSHAAYNVSSSPVVAMSLFPCSVCFPGLLWDFLSRLPTRSITRSSNVFGKILLYTSLMSSSGNFRTVSFLDSFEL